MFAPAHHQATRFVMPVRRELAVRTIFNLLGPLTNPAGVARSCIGVSDARYLETMAGALAKLGVDRALVVSSEDGLDELSASAPTRVIEVNGARAVQLRRRARRAGHHGRARGGGAVIAGGTPEDNAETTRAILAGEGDGAPHPRALAVVNAGAAIYAAGARIRSPTACSARGRDRPTARRRGAGPLRRRQPRHARDEALR